MKRKAEKDRNKCRKIKNIRGGRKQWTKGSEEQVRVV